MTTLWRKAFFGIACLMMTGLFHAPGAFAEGAQEVLAALTTKSGTAIEVIGVVFRLDAAKGTFALVDRSEIAKCKDGSKGGSCCDPKSLPVQWKGTLPKVSDVVRIKGAVRATKAGKFFVADSVEKVTK
jgi:hypothetical protein